MNGQDLSIQQIQSYFQEYGFSPLIFNISDSCSKIVDDIAIVQSFCGVDISRIQAATTALLAMLKSTVKPKEWIFVEEQECSSNCCFKWLKKYGIKHVFAKKSQNAAYVDKFHLWNIGAKVAQSSRLCFIDSSIVFCNSGWLNDVDELFALKYNVMSLHGWMYAQDHNNISPTQESFGHKHMHKFEASLQLGDFGHAFGISRTVFNALEQINEDLRHHIDLFSILVNQNCINEMMNYAIEQLKAKNIEISIGSTEQTICRC